MSEALSLLARSVLEREREREREREILWSFFSRPRPIGRLLSSRCSRTIGNCGQIHTNVGLAGNWQGIGSEMKASQSRTRAGQTEAFPSHAHREGV